MATLFTTVFLYPFAKHVEPKDGEVLKRDPNVGHLRELRGFTYACGHNLPGLPRPLVATSDETNLDQANQLPEGLHGVHVASFEWSIPAVAKGAYQQDLGPSVSGRDYKVTAKDVAEFASKAYIAFYCGGEKPFAEMVPASKEILFDGNEYTQVVSDFNRTPLEIRRLEKMWTSVVWNHEVLPNIGGVVPVHFILRGAGAPSGNVRAKRRL